MMRFIELYDIQIKPRFKKLKSCVLLFAIVLFKPLHQFSKLLRAVPLCFAVFIFPNSISGQEKIKAVLDSLEAQANFKMELKIGNEEKAKALLKKIDTSEISRTQVDFVHEYYSLHTVKAEEYPYPLLLWTEATSKKLNYTEGILESLKQYGFNATNTDPEASLNAFQKALKLYKHLEDKQGIAYIQSRIGLWYFGRTDYVKALNYLFESLEIYSELGEEENMVSAYHNIADTYRHIKDTVNTIKYLKLSSALEQRYPHPGIRVMNNNFLGEIYLKQGNYDNAFVYLTRSNETIKKTGELPYVMLYNLLYLGTIEEKRGNLEKAFSFYKKSFVQSYLLEGGSNIAFIIATRMAHIYLTLDQPKEAITLLETLNNRKNKPDELQLNDRTFSFHEEFYAIMAQTYERLGDFQNANRYTKKRIAVIDSINAVAVFSNASELEKKYQSKIDKQEIRLLKDKEEISAKNFLITVISMAAVVLILLLAIGSYFQRIKTLKRKQTLNEMALQNEQIRANNLEKEQEIVRLEFALEQKKMVEQIRLKISADLHDDVGSVLTGLSMQSEILENQVPQKTRVKLNRISQLSRDAMLKMRDTVWALDSEKDTIQALEDRIKDFAIENLGSKDISFEFNIEGKNKSDNLHSLTRQNLYLIAKESIANVLKHSNASHLHFTLQFINEEIVFTIKDDGVLLQNSFSTSGLGLSNIKKRVKQLDGNVEFSSENGFGIHIKIPMKIRKSLVR